MSHGKHKLPSAKAVARVPRARPQLSFGGPTPAPWPVPPRGGPERGSSRACSQRHAARGPRKREFWASEVAPCWVLGLLLSFTTMPQKRLDRETHRQGSRRACFKFSDNRERAACVWVGHGASHCGALPFTARQSDGPRLTNS